jgi:hypothetical protein
MPATSRGCKSGSTVGTKARDSRPGPGIEAWWVGWGVAGRRRVGERWLGRRVVSGRLARVVGGARNGFPFLPLHSRWSVSDRCGRALRPSMHRPIALTMRGDLCVTVLQVYGVGGANLHQMVDSRRRFFDRDAGLGGREVAAWRGSGHGRARTDPGPRPGVFKWRWVAIEWSKGPDLGRRAVSSRLERARGWRRPKRLSVSATARLLERL